MILDLIFEIIKNEHLLDIAVKHLFDWHNVQILITMVWIYVYDQRKTYIDLKHRFRINRTQRIVLWKHNDSMYARV